MTLALALAPAPALTLALTLALATATATATAPAAPARVLHVGPGQTYRRPCQAIAAARPGDRIEIDARGNRVYRATCAPGRRIA